MKVFDLWAQQLRDFLFSSKNYLPQKIVVPVYLNLDFPIRGRYFLTNILAYGNFSVTTWHFLGPWFNKFYWILIKTKHYISLEKLDKIWLNLKRLLSKREGLLRHFLKHCFEIIIRKHLSCHGVPRLPPKSILEDEIEFWFIFWQMSKHLVVSIHMIKVDQLTRHVYIIMIKETTAVEI